MKSFIVCDDYSDYKEIMNEKDLIRLLLKDIKEDTLENYNDKDIIKSNFEIMEKLVLNDYTIDYLKEQLQSYGWYIQDLWKLLQDLSNFQAYKHGSGCPIIPKDCIEETIKMIESEIK